MYAKKSLGQNFLKSKAALNSIKTRSNLTSEDIVLEVGPGKGALTAVLLPFPAKLIAIEKDESLVELLTEKFSKEIGEGKLSLITGDVLEFDPEVMNDYDLSRHNYKIVANIPYYITGVFIRKFLTANTQPKQMVLLVQKEVAERIVARDGKESILSLSVKAYGIPSYVETVKAKYFSPEPNVDSAIISIENISRDFFKEFSEESFFKVVKTAFAHKRKQIGGNLREVYKKEAVEAALFKAEISGTARAEDLPLPKWKELTAALETTIK